MPQTASTVQDGIPSVDTAVIRELARKVAEIGNYPVQKEKAAMWQRHNDLERVRPMVLVFPEGSWRELLPDSVLRTTDPFCRNLEYDLRMRIYMWEHLPDDNVIEPVVFSPIITHTSGWGLELKRTPSTEARGAFHIDPVIHDEADLDKLTLPTVTVDWEETERVYNITRELVGDILLVEKQGKFRGHMAPMDMYSQLRGIDAMFMDLVDNPQMVHRAMRILVDGHIGIIKSLEEQGALSLGNRNHYAGSGGTSYTSELPQPDFDPAHVRTMDQWGFATAQIFSEVSPTMHEEFALEHEARYLSLFGLNCYGCCEPLHHKLDAMFRHIPRLRRISISPWAEVKTSAQKFGADYIFSYKPNPADLAGENWNPQKVRDELTRFREITRDNVVEIIMKDTHTVRGDPQRMWEWVRIAREVVE